MSQHLVWTLARALAAGRRVLIAHEPFDAVLLLAEADVRELVVVSPDADPDAPTGQTALGAPLRLRADWRERPQSKDLIVDREGTADAESVTRLLKKGGLYLTATRGPALDAFPHVVEVVSHVATAWVTGTGVASALVLGEPGAAGPSVFLAGRERPEVPTVVCARADQPPAAPEPPAPPPPPDRSDEIEALEAELDTMRTELAERRAEDRRVELIRANAEAARQKINAECESLRERLRDLESPAADLQQVLAERDVLRRTFEQVASAFQALTARAADAIGVPPPATSGETVLAGWLEAGAQVVERALSRGEADGTLLAEARVRLAAATTRLREQAEALVILQAEAAERGGPTPAAEPPPPEQTELLGRIAALEAALVAEQTLRQAERAEHARARRTAEGAGGRLRAQSEQLETARRGAAQARLAHAAADDERARLRAELDLRDARQADLESMLRAHARMEALLTDALQRAEEARDIAEAERRLADGSLQLLRAEIDRRAAESSFDRAGRGPQNREP